MEDEGVTFNEAYESGMFFRHRNTKPGVVFKGNDPEDVRVSIYQDGKYLKSEVWLVWFDNEPIENNWILLPNYKSISD